MSLDLAGEGTVPDLPDDAPKPADYLADDKAKNPGGLDQATSAKLAKKWASELTASRRWLQRFTRTARICEKAYLDERENLTGDESRVNLFWSNTQVILSAIYGKLPQAEVDRKFKDFDDDIARVAAIILERILNGDIEREYDDTNAAMRDAVQDRFISGLGQVWCRYDADTEDYDSPVIDPMTGQPQLDDDGAPVTEKASRIVNEEAEVDYVYWDDFRFSPCRRWRDCRWVARRVYLSRTKLADRFKLTPAQLGLIPMQTKTPGEGATTQDDVLKATPFRQAAVWEIWDKDSNSVCWYVEGCNFVLDYQDDYLELDDFFPCPMPVVATTLTRAFLPRADYAMAQDLYVELDRINNKLARLQEAVKAAGVYDKNSEGVKQLLSSNTENTLIPVENWNVFTEKGGLKGVVDWMPIDATVNAIMQLTQRKGALEQDLYGVLGISDIMRGTSAASETLGAQQLKAQYGGARLADMQNGVARFVSDTMRIRANIVSKLFQPETIKQRSLIERTPDAPFADQAIALLKNFGMAMHSVTVTADSLAAPDWESEKQTRTEFMGAVSNFLMAAAPMVQQDPTTGGFLVKLLQWGTAGFKGSASIEGVLDQAARAMEAKSQQPPAPPPPSPADQKDMASAKKMDAETGKVQAETQQIQMNLGASSAQTQANAAKEGATASRTHEEARAMKAQNNAILGPEFPGLGQPPGASLSGEPGPFQGMRGAPNGNLPAAPGTIAPLQPVPPQLAPPQ